MSSILKLQHNHLQSQLIHFRFTSIFRPHENVRKPLRKKRSYLELFWSQSECGKIRTRITPNTDTFHAVNWSREKLGTVIEQPVMLSSYNFPVHTCVVAWVNVNKKKFSTRQNRKKATQHFIGMCILILFFVLGIQQLIFCSFYCSLKIHLGGKMVFMQSGCSIS